MLRNSSPSYAFAIVADAEASFLDVFSAALSSAAARAEMSTQRETERLRGLFKASSS
jgi:hypothetical protein